jgi:hypothetical protein
MQGPAIAAGCPECGCCPPGPQGYNLAEPKKYVLSESLREISGITFLKGDADTMYAIEDETGKLYSFHLGSGRFPYHKFGKHGDYEDVTVLNDKEFVVLRSDGSLFVFPVEAVRSARASKDGGEGCRSRCGPMNISCRRESMKGCMEMRGAS